MVLQESYDLEQLAQYFLLFNIRTTKELILTP